MLYVLSRREPGSNDFSTMSIHSYLLWWHHPPVSLKCAGLSNSRTFLKLEKADSGLSISCLSQVNWKTEDWWIKSTSSGIQNMKASVVFLCFSFLFPLYNFSSNSCFKGLVWWMLLFLWSCSQLLLLTRHSHFCLWECFLHQSKLVNDTEICRGNRIPLFYYCLLKKAPFLIVSPVVHSFLVHKGLHLLSVTFFCDSAASRLRFTNKTKITPDVVK